MRTTLLIGLVILGLGAGLRLAGLDFPFWDDERMTVACAVGVDYRSPLDPGEGMFSSRFFWKQNHISSVVEATVRDGGNAVGFNLLLHFWIMAFGPSDSAMRMLPVLLGWILLWAGWLAGKKICPNDKVALLFLALLAAHPLLIKYSQTLRGYSLATLAAFGASVIFFFLILKGEKFRRPAFAYFGYGLLAALAMLSHYLTVYIFLVHAVFLFLKRPPLRLAAGFLVSAVSGMAIFLLWMYGFGAKGFEWMQEMQAAYRVLLADPEVENLWVMPATLKTLLAGLVGSLNHLTGSFPAAYGIRMRWHGWLSIFPLFLFYQAFRRYLKGKDLNGLFFLTLAVIPFPFFFIMALKAGHTASLAGLYFIFSVPFALFILADQGIWGLTQLKKGAPKKGEAWVSSVSLGIVMILMLFSLRFPYEKVDIWPENFPFRASEKICETYQPGDLIRFSGVQQAFLVNLYLQDRPDIVQEVRPSAEGHILRISNSSGNRDTLMNFDVRDMSFGDIFEAIEERRSRDNQ